MERYNIVVIGAGSGGLVVAAGGAGLGARVALLEKHRMGGDCLNYGCVPSKALLKAAKVAQAAREAGRFGLSGISDPGPQDLKAVMDYVRSCQAHIAPHDSVERFTELGVEVSLSAGKLVSPHEVEIAESGTRIWGRHIVLATGSRPFVPPIEGLEAAGYLTNETVFDAETLPGRLAVIGGGPIGVELGQAFARLGSKVTIISSSAHILPKEDPDIAAVLSEKLRGEGIEIVDAARAGSVSLRDGQKVITAVSKDGSGSRETAVDEILVAAGRSPNVENLGLEPVGVRMRGRFVETDAWGRTSVPSVWAIGDVAGRYLFTHWAGYEARGIIRNILFPGRSRIDDGNVPWTTFTEPEVAHVGLTESDAREKGIAHRVFTAPFDGNDRAVCDGEHEGYFARVMADRKGGILGASIVHPHAGDLLAELVLAKKNGLTLSGLSKTIHTYPTLSEINRSLGDAFEKTRLTPSTKNWLTKAYAWLRR